ncbi:hypothetical protein AN214_02177 [Pseudoalteromonas sp. P1-9]|uniref:DUF3087 domain-containing protein n=1 Tax=Pseudoalteromonas sp. P1-9 TaxID=1710354 RepID=UPI0006D60DED|nr:DUF3087 domain-containing protein [Pseudoalteromonas sp. P1-9]KPV95790.1 hypothetical protein AN214_02177 [Pseudoalteromonas sp. P1-9]
MKLQEINKARYRNHLNKVIVGCIVALVVGSLGIAQGLIAVLPNEQGGHFHWNLAGVVISCLVIGSVLKKYKHHDFMTEVTYVWELKKQLNYITRKMRKLKAAVEEGDVIAMQIINYSYAGSRQLWQLDDNTITMEELSIWQAELDAKAREVNVVLDSEKYDPQSLANY